MSRYAMEWARQQQAPTPQAKVVLLLMADRAEGPDHRLKFHAYVLVTESGLAYRELREAVGSLAASGLIESGELGPATPHPTWPDSPTPCRLLIPQTWRCPAARRPRRETPDSAVPTAVYRLFDASGRLLYVGISDRPEIRFSQHERDKFWWRDVVTREVWWHPDRYSAEAEEYRAVASDGPEYNVDVSGRSVSDDRARQERRRRYVVTNSRLGAFEKTLVRLGEDLEGGTYGGDALPGVDDLAERYGVDAMTIQQVLRALRSTGVVTEVTGGKYWPRRGGRR